MSTKIGPVVFEQFQVHGMHLMFCKSATHASLSESHPRVILLQELSRLSQITTAT